MPTPPLRSAYRFPDEPDGIELRAFTHGLQPASVPTMMEHFTEDWRRYGVDAWNEVPNHWRPESGDAVGWWTLPTYLADHFVAPLLGAPAETCILQPSVHWTVQCLLSCPEVAERGSDIVIPETAFPSVLHSAKRWSESHSYSPVVVPTTNDHRVDPGAVCDAVGPETALVALSHVGFTTGARLPDAALADIAEHAHSHDALFLVDGYHAAATMPIDVQELQCDLYVGGLLKEGSGSAGNAFLYVRPERTFTPQLTGWFGDAAPFGFRPDPEPHPDVRRRFLGGTTAVAPFYHAVEGVRTLLDLGLEAVREHSLRLTDRAIDHVERLPSLSLRSPRARAHRSALVLVEVEEAERLCAHLKKRHVYTDSRQNRLLRMAPFVWNTVDEVDRAFAHIETALSTNAHLTAEPGQHGPVT